VAKLAVFGGLWHVLAVFGTSFFSAPVINTFIKVVFADGSMFHRAGCFATKVYRFLPVNEKNFTIGDQALSDDLGFHGLA